MLVCRRDPRLHAQQPGRLAEGVAPRGLHRYPTKVQLQDCQYCTHDLTVEVECRIDQGVSTGASTELFGEASCESRAGLNKWPPRKSPRRLVIGPDVVSLVYLPH